MTSEVNYSENYDVFLSYRRDGGETMAILLRDRLVAKGYKVFLDIESLNSGSFNKKLLSVIEGCTDVVVVCSKGSLDRCINAGDWVRMEIAHALKNDKNVVPIFLRDFKWPDVLPDDIEALRVQNGVNANSTEYFDAAVDRLASKFLQSMPHSSVTKKSNTLKQPKVKKPITSKTKSILATALSLVLVVGLVFGGMALWGKKGGTLNNPNDPLTYDKGVIINGVKWATRNVDAPGTFAAKPEDAGMFYQWNRKKAWPATGEITDWNGYNVVSGYWEKYNDPSPTGWRVPTLDEIKELLDTDKVSNIWATQNNIYGRKFTDKANGNTLFLPAAGYREVLGGGVLNDVGRYGYYWSNMQYLDNGEYALYFFSRNSDVYNANPGIGISVRPVAD